MTDTQYKAIAAHIARHCMNHLRFVYNANFDFENFILSIRVHYRAPRSIWRLNARRFTVENWTIRKGNEAPDIDFDANELLKYLN